MANQPRPGTLHTVNSFSRFEASTSDPASPRKRASTLQESGIPTVPAARLFDRDDAAGRKHVADIFEVQDEAEESGEKDGEEQATPGYIFPTTFADLPIEIRSLTERFLESLSAKVHPQPLNADNLSDLFQEFYEKAATHIATHIASLASRIGREIPAKQAISSARGSLAGRPRAGSGTPKNKSSDSLASQNGGEMLTPTEVAERRKARKILELKRLALEEAVERSVCEKVYDKIWKHRSTDDDARDEKLRSRTAALAVVGIGLKELHGTDDKGKEDMRKLAEEKADEINLSLAPARDALQQMNDEHCPLGKLQHLKAAHKSIVDTLTQFFPSSSSADEILPTLIYTLITSPPEGISVVSNLSFIQRFRAASKVDGEAAYCLVNLEAAISFLETVDLSSLRSDELPQGPSRGPSQPVTPSVEKSEPDHPGPTLARALTPEVTPTTVTAADRVDVTSETTSVVKDDAALQRPNMHTRRISSMMQAQAVKIEASRENILNAADRIYDSINGTLDNSLEFVFGRFREQAGSGSAPLPKTLEDARKLVNSSESTDDDALSVNERSLLSPATKSEKKMLELISGRKPTPRDRSADSTISGGSASSVNRRTPTTDTTSATRIKPELTLPGSATAVAAANSAGQLLATINPLNRFGMPTFPRFGRASGPASPAQASTPVITTENDAKRLVSGGKETASTAMRDTDGDDYLNAREALATLRQIKPPNKRFLEVGNVNNLRLGEVEELLMEYRRLAKAIADAIAN